MLLACGGTGGHLAPGIALAQRLRSRGSEPLLLVSRKVVDARMLARYPELRFRAGRGRGFGPGWIDRLLFAPSMVIAFLDACWVVARFRPDAIACFGGFMSVGPALACWLAGVPVHLHEANLRAGKAIRALAPLATTIHAPPSAGLSGPRVRPGGFPLRAEMHAVDRAAARQALGFPADGRLLLVVGGSQGAAALNRWAEGLAPELASRDCHVLCLTGPGGVDRTDSHGARIARYLPFCDRMAEAYSAADLAISRAGAGTLAELAACGTPAVLVPYPRAADDHQTANARAREVLGCAVLVRESELDALRALTLRLLSDAEGLAGMRAALVQAHRLNRWEELVDAIDGVSAKEVSA